MPEILETDCDRTAGLIERRVQIHAQAGDSRPFERIGGANCKHSKALLRSRQRARQELAFSTMQLQRKHQLVPALPAVLRQQPRTGDEMGERRGIGGRHLGALTSDQVELCQLLAFLWRSDQHGAAIELINDLEYCPLSLLCGSVCCQQPPNSEVGLGA